MRGHMAWRCIWCCAALFALTGCELSSASPTTPDPAQSTSSRVTTAAAPSRAAQATVTPQRTPGAATPSASAASAAPTMQPAARLDTPGSALTVLAWSSDGQTLAGSAGATDTRDYAVHLWRADGTALATLVGHSERIPALSWSPDGRVLASGSADGTVRLWSATGAALNTLSLPAQWVYGLAWSPDGQTLAVGAIQVPSTVVRSGTPTPIVPGTVTLWSTAGELRATLDPPRRTGGKFFHVAWSRDGSTLAAGAVTFAIWRADGTLVAALDEVASPAWGMAFSPDGAVLATGNENRLLRLYTGTGVLFATLGDMNTGSLTFSPSGTTLAASVGSGGVSLLDVVGTQVTVRDLPVRGNPQSNVVWSPDGTRLVAGFSDETVQIWRAMGDSTRSSLAAEVSRSASRGRPTGAQSRRRPRMGASASGTPSTARYLAYTDKCGGLWHISHKPPHPLVW